MRMGVHTVQVGGSFQDLKDKCGRGAYQPCLVFYELV
jgi:hypothetical protein